MRPRTKTKPKRIRRDVAGSGHRVGGLAERLRQARIETVRDVAAVLGHEANNLLGALGTCVQLLRRNPHISPEDAEILDIIQTGSHRLGEIVSQFSAFRQAKPLRFEEVELHALIEETLGMLQRDERCPSSIFIRRRFAPSLPNVKADRERLAQLLCNLFLNAVQAMGDRGQLEVQTERAGREVRIAVRDTGPGIPRAILPRIFEPFYTTKPRGIGLGLAIARCIIDEHGGRVLVGSEEDGGTCFTVALPIKRKEGRAGMQAR